MDAPYESSTCHQYVFLPRNAAHLRHKSHVVPAPLTSNAHKSSPPLPLFSAARQQGPNKVQNACHRNGITSKLHVPSMELQSISWTAVAVPAGAAPGDGR